MGYRITVDQSNCINCGVCMDVCPVQALDMTRPERPGVEAGGGPGFPFNWMMEYPVQRLFRDAMVCVSAGGTTEIGKLVVSRAALS